MYIVAAGELNIYTSKVAIGGEENLETKEISWLYQELTYLTLALTGGKTGEKCSCNR